MSANISACTCFPSLCSSIFLFAHDNIFFIDSSVFFGFCVLQLLDLFIQLGMLLHPCVVCLLLVLDLLTTLSQLCLCVFVRLCLVSRVCCFRCKWPWYSDIYLNANLILRPFQISCIPANTLLLKVLCTLTFPKNMTFYPSTPCLV